MDEQVLRVSTNLRRKKQVLLHGPPGTGKTRLALSTALAMFGRTPAISAGSGERNAAIQDLLDQSSASAVPTPARAEGSAVADTGGSGHQIPPVTLATFHPTYGYEDFVEGYKPTASGDGTLALRRFDGLFTKICRAAEQHPDQDYLLIIDEINRADLARVLGELVTILEHDKRGHAITLPISGEQLRVPANVHLIGTMNTADRSLAHIDRAIQRRFAKIQVPPDPGLLDSNVGGLNLQRLLAGLNARVRTELDADHLLGHSFFLSDDVPLDDEDRLHSVFYDEIVPLLQDYTFDQPSLLSELIGADLASDAGELDELPSHELPEVLAKEFNAGVDDA